MPDLRELAEHYIRLESEIDHVRSQMLKALSNGRGGESEFTERTMKARPPKPGGYAEKMAAAQAARDQILEILKTRATAPAELARTTNVKLGTLNERLRRAQTGPDRAGGNRRLARRRELTPEELVLIDGHPPLPPGVEPWLKRHHVNIYLRKLTSDGRRLDIDDEGEERTPPRRNGARAGDSYMR